MLTVVDNRTGKDAEQVFTGDLAEGTVFSGKVADYDGKTYSGIWLVLNVGFIEDAIEPYVVLLNRRYPGHPEALLGVEGDRPVTNFQELNATLTVTATDEDADNDLLGGDPNGY